MLPWYVAQIYAVSDEELDEKFRREDAGLDEIVHSFYEVARQRHYISYVKYVQEEIPSCQANIEFSLYPFGSNYVLFEDAFVNSHDNLFYQLFTIIQPIVSVSVDFKI